VKGMRWLILDVSLALAWLLGCAASTGSYYNDGEKSTADRFQASISTVWSQTSQADFSSGALTDADASASPGDVQLNTATTILGDWHNDSGAAMVAVLTQSDSFATVPYNGEITSWTYYNAGKTSNDVRLEFLSGSGPAWTMMAKSDAVSVNGTNTFAVSMPVLTGWQLGIYSGSGKLNYNIMSGTLSGRTENSGDLDPGITQTDFSQSTGQLALTAVLRHYNNSGGLASQVLDTHVSGAKWSALAWDKTLQSGTSITLMARASDSLFAKEAAFPSWVSIGNTSPVTSALPPGRYKQWLATLTTTDTAKTPVLHEVRLYYYSSSEISSRLNPH
jgi:hypothetical protein